MALFVGALFAPVLETDSAVPEHGYLFAAFGFLGPFEFCFAWYANIPLLLCAMRMARGLQPKRSVAWVGAALALTALAPHFIFDFEVDAKWHIDYFYGPAIWLWLGSFAVTVAAALLAPSRDDEAHRTREASGQS